MKKKITKKEIVKLLLNQNLEEGNEEELMDSLVKEPVAIDIIKEDEESKSFGERLADKLTKVAGSWSFLLCFILFKSFLVKVFSRRSPCLLYWSAHIIA